jgi:ribonuclease P protein component
MLKKPNRLTTKFQFNIVRKYGQRQNFDIFGVTTLTPRNYEGPAKIGFVVPNSINKSAVRRNKIKRQLREAFRKKMTMIPNNLWITVFVNQKILSKNYEEISTQVDRFVQKISVSN